MGYVLPVSEYQYQDYKNRMVGDKRGQFYIEGPYKISLKAYGYQTLQKKPQRINVSS